MTDSIYIAAVFATMSRAATAVACVRALAAQTRPPNLVVVADNVSGDDTVGALEDLQGLPFPLVVQQMRENAGNAGGVAEAMDLAFAKGADAVWILDDDSWPQAGALEAMLHGSWNPDVVRHALQVNPKTGRFTWPLWVKDGRDWSLAWSEDDLSESPTIPSKASWTGALIPRKIRDRVGPVNGDLFIRGEDEEYPWRIAAAGFGFEVVRAAIMDHPGPDELVHLSVLGKHFFLERGLADWKLYYKVRNMVWLKRRQSGAIKALAMGVTYALATAWVDGTQRLPLVWEAAGDGWRGRLGFRIKAEKLKS